MSENPVSARNSENTMKMKCKRDMVDKNILITLQRVEKTIIMKNLTFLLKLYVTFFVTDHVFKRTFALIAFPNSKDSLIASFKNKYDDKVHYRVFHNHFIKYFFFLIAL